jgi:hypothetical protein
MKSDNNGSTRDQEWSMATMNAAVEHGVESWLLRHPQGAPLAAVANLLRAATGGGSGSLADPAAISAYCDGVGVRGDELRRLWDDPALRRQVAATARLLGTPPVRSAVPRQRRVRRWSVTGVGLAAAAVIVAALIPHPKPTTPPEDAHRAGTINAAEVHILTPLGVVRAAPTVEWSSVLGADIYEVEATSGDGRVVFRDRTTDTSVRVPRAVVSAGGRYFVRVRARIGAGRWIASDFREFTIQP